MTVMHYARAAGIPMEYIADDEVDLETFGRTSHKRLISRL